LVEGFLGTVPEHVVAALHQDPRDDEISETLMRSFLAFE